MWHCLLQQNAEDQGGDWKDIQVRFEHPYFLRKEKWRRHVKIKKIILCIRTLEIQKQTLEKS